MPITVDGLQEAQEIIPEGTYLAKYNGTKQVEYGDEGDPQKALIVSFTVTEEGEWAGEELTQFFNMDKRGLRFFASFMQNMGAEVDGDEVDDEPCQDIDYLLTVSHYTRKTGEVVASIKRVSIAS